MRLTQGSLDINDKLGQLLFSFFTWKMRMEQWVACKLSEQFSSSSCCTKPPQKFGLEMNSWRLSIRRKLWARSYAETELYREWIVQILLATLSFCSAKSELCKPCFVNIWNSVFYLFIPDLSPFANVLDLNNQTIPCWKTWHDGSTPSNKFNTKWPSTFWDWLRLESSPIKR